MSQHGEPNKPQRLFYFLQALTALTREHGVIVSGDLEFTENRDGMYCLNPNNEGPEFGWVSGQGEIRPCNPCPQIRERSRERR